MSGRDVIRYWVPLAVEAGRSLCTRSKQVPPPPGGRAAAPRRGDNARAAHALSLRGPSPYSLGDLLFHSGRFFILLADVGRSYYFATNRDRYWNQNCKSNRESSPEGIEIDNRNKVKIECGAEIRIESVTAIGTRSSTGNRIGVETGVASGSPGRAGVFVKYFMRRQLIAADARRGLIADRRRSSETVLPREARFTELALFLIRQQLPA
ncbi:hypothetical protein EVAR_44742_1 [Eumeta japonica]|uniref:Uncharacterized protein n=1 Tax=Eumeta variegata TaxID=151549 RepID=A0A4C1XHP1_EUMVA|nr:hypothetical protein EVAR_44742_1 [Eumeta japonica]